MRYDDATLQDRLAAEYAFGNLRGAARRRMVTLMDTRPGLHDKVTQLEESVLPLALRASRIAPPPRVWRAIHARIAPRAARRPPAWLARLLLGSVAAAAAALLVFFAVVPLRAPTLIAVLNDAQARPGMIATWTPESAQRRELALRIVAHPSMPPDTSWQAWLLPGSTAAPIALGFVTSDETQRLELSPAAAAALRAGAAIGVSVEAKGGSTSGRPTLPFAFEGKLASSAS